MQTPASRLDYFLSFTVLAEPIDVTSAVVASIFEQFQLSQPMLKSEEPLSLDRIYIGSPPPGGAHPHRVVLYAPKSSIGSTVVITNRRDGWSSLSRVLAKRLGAKQAQLTATNKIEYPAVLFCAWLHGTERAVVCMRDGHAWVFHTQGQELPFEETSAYSARRISKRLTREMALRYVKALGWDAAESEFWQAQGDAIYFEQGTLN